MVIFFHRRLAPGAFEIWSRCNYIKWPPTEDESGYARKSVGDCTRRAARRVKKCKKCSKTRIFGFARFALRIESGKYEKWKIFCSPRNSESIRANCARPDRLSKSWRVFEVSCTFPFWRDGWTELAEFWIFIEAGWENTNGIKKILIFQFYRFFGGQTCFDLPRVGGLVNFFLFYVERCAIQNGSRNCLSRNFLFISFFVTQ